MDRRTATAFDPYPVRVRVMGEHLERLTLRHLFVLLLQENPVVGRGGAGYGEALLAARVLGARDEEDLRRRLTECDRRTGRWMVALRAAWWRRRAAGEMYTLRRWLEAELGAMPELLPGAPGKRRPFQIDWLVVLVAKLVREGMMLEEAWWTPAAQAGHLRLAWEEMDGKEFTVLTDELQAELEEMGHTF